MNTEKKLEYFTEAITKEVETKKRQARRQMAQDSDRDISHAVTAFEAEALAQNQPQIQAISKVMNKRITDAETEARRSFVYLQERLVLQLFDEIKGDIVSFTQSPEYESYLISSIQTAIKQSSQAYTFVQLSPQGMHLGSAVEKATGLMPEQGEESFIGGFRLFTENRTKMQDHTIAARLAEARQEFATELMHLIPKEA
ncbi:MAG: hypothetical protein FWE42_06340 [Defluviitaleaceae bacterium]|nr:hypothetical protein [Defluviitaleaceae bacterium]